MTEKDRGHAFDRVPGAAGEAPAAERLEFYADVRGDIDNL